MWETSTNFQADTLGELIQDMAEYYTRDGGIFWTSVYPEWLAYRGDDGEYKYASKKLLDKFNHRVDVKANDIAERLMEYNKQEDYA